MGTFKPETPIFDGKNPWVSGSDFPNKTNPLKLIFQGTIAIYCWYITNKYTNINGYFIMIGNCIFPNEIISFVEELLGEQGGKKGSVCIIWWQEGTHETCWLIFVTNVGEMSLGWDWSIYLIWNPHSHIISSTDCRFTLHTWGYKKHQETASNNHRLMDPGSDSDQPS